MPTAEQNQPSEESNMVMPLVRDPLGQETPKHTKRNTNDHFYRSMKNKFPQWSTLTEGEPKEDTKATDGHNIICRAGSNDQGGDTLGHPIPSGGQAHQAWDDDSWGHSREHKPQHEANSPREAEDQIGKYGDHDCFNKTGNECGPHNHCTELHKCNRIQLQPRHQQDHCQTDGSQGSGDGRIQVMTNVSGMTFPVIHFLSFAMAIITSNSNTSSYSIKKLITIKLSLYLIRNTSLPGPMILRCVKIVDTVPKSSILMVSCALCSSKLTEVVRDVLEKDSNNQHSQERGQPDVKFAEPEESPAEEEHKLASQESN